MGRKRKMIDTSIDEADEEVPLSRTKQRALRKDLQGRLDGIAKRLAKLRREEIEALGLGEDVAREVALLAKMRVGSSFARQRRRVAGLLRDVDLDALEANLERAFRKR
ncbi:MAG: DUF615 domain-containing protein [Myxococcota bacterium]